MATLPYIVWISIGMATIGIGLTVYGLYAWRSRQAVRDESENLQQKKLKNELEPMTPKQIDTKANRELEPEAKGESGTSLNR